MKLIKVKSYRVWKDEVALYRIRRGDAFQPWAEAKVYIKGDTDRRPGLTTGVRFVTCQPLGGGRSWRFSIAHRVYRRRDLCVCPLSEVK